MASLRALLEQALTDRGWSKSASPSGYSAHAWIKIPAAFTRCNETGLLAALARELQLEDDFGEGTHADAPDIRSAERIVKKVIRENKEWLKEMADK